MITILMKALKVAGKQKKWFFDSINVLFSFFV